MSGGEVELREMPVHDAEGEVGIVKKAIGVLETAEAGLGGEVGDVAGEGILKKSEKGCDCGRTGFRIAGFFEEVAEGDSVGVYVDVVRILRVKVVVGRFGMENGEKLEFGGFLFDGGGDCAPELVANPVGKGIFVSPGFEGLSPVALSIVGGMFKRGRCLTERVAVPKVFGAMLFANEGEEEKDEFVDTVVVITLDGVVEIMVDIVE